MIWPIIMAHLNMNFEGDQWPLLGCLYVERTSNRSPGMSSSVLAGVNYQRVVWNEGQWQQGPCRILVICYPMNNNCIHWLAWRRTTSMPIEKAKHGRNRDPCGGNPWDSTLLSGVCSVSPGVKISERVEAKETTAIRFVQFIRVKRRDCEGLVDICMCSIAGTRSSRWSGW